MKNAFVYNGNVYYNSQEEFDVESYISDVVTDRDGVLQKSKTLNAIASKSLSVGTKAKLVASLAVMGLPNLARAVEMGGEIVRGDRSSFSQMAMGSLRNLMGFVLQSTGAVRGIGTAANKTTEAANELLSSVTTWMVKAEVLPEWVGHRVDITGLFLMSVIIMGIVMGYRHLAYKVERQTERNVKIAEIEARKEIVLKWMKSGKKGNEEQLFKLLSVADSGYQQYLKG
jgi:hypothetical protein